MQNEKIKQFLKKERQKKLTRRFRKLPKWGWIFVVLGFVGALSWIPKINDLGIRISSVIIDVDCVASFKVSSERDDAVSVEIEILGSEIPSARYPGGVVARGKVSMNLAPNSEIQVKEQIWCQPFIRTMMADARVVRLTRIGHR